MSGENAQNKENSIMIYGLPTALKCNMLERSKYKVEVTEKEEIVAALEIDKTHLQEKKSINMKGAAGGGI